MITRPNLSKEQIGLLALLFAVIFVAMLGVTTWATLEESVSAGFDHVTAYRWGWATLADAYCGFITFFVFVCLTQKSNLKRIIWFFAIALFGNIAMSAYAILFLRHLSKTQEAK